MTTHGGQYESRRQKEKRNTSTTEESKATAEQEYGDAEREVKNTHDVTKGRQYIKGLATRAEEAVAMRNTRELYQIIKQMSGKMFSCDAPVKDKRKSADY